MPASAPLRLAAGLGNPGAEYAQTRHNAGFWWLEKLARSLAVGLRPESRFQAFIGRAQLPAGEVLLVAPQTFMNASGRAVGAIAQFFKIPAEQILVVHDELDLAPGTAKLKFGGGHGGHNGLKDIKQALGSSDFWRLRIGIGHPGERAAVVDYVLHAPRREERAEIYNAIDMSLALAPQIIRGEMEAAMLKLHTRGA